MGESGIGARRMLQLERRSETGVCGFHRLLPPVEAQSQGQRSPQPACPCDTLWLVSGSAKPWVAAVGGEDSPALSTSILLPSTHTLPPSLAPQIPIPSHADQCLPVPSVPAAQGWLVQWLQPVIGVPEPGQLGISARASSHTAQVQPQHPPQAICFISSGFNCACQPLRAWSGHQAPARLPAAQLWDWPGGRHAARSSLPFPSHSLGPIQHKVNF